MNKQKIAVLLSVIFPGFGHFYLKQWVDGIVFLVATGFLWFVALFVKEGQGPGIHPQMYNFESPRAYIFWGGMIIVYLYAIFDSYKKAGGLKTK